MGRKRNILTAKQKKFAAMLANVDEFNFTLNEFAEALKIGTATVSRWKNDPNVIDLSNKISDETLKKYLPKVNSMIVEKAIVTKDVTAANTFFKRLDRQVFEGRGLRELSSDEILLMVRDGKKEL